MLQLLPGVIITQMVLVLVLQLLPVQAVMLCQALAANRMIVQVMLLKSSELGCDASTGGNQIPVTAVGLPAVRVFPAATFNPKVDGFTTDGKVLHFHFREKSFGMQTEMGEFRGNLRFLLQEKDKAGGLGNVVN